MTAPGDRSDPTPAGRSLPDQARRRRAAALAGHRQDESAARALLADPSPVVRATALRALARMAALTETDVASALADADPVVRRDACAVAVPWPAVDLVPLTADRDPHVVEAACWALGEREDAAAVDALTAVAGSHSDALCREAAVAALGAIGDERGLPAVLAAATDKPAVRRRAVVALAAFEGPEVEAALERAGGDRDRQVRQAAEDLLAE